MKSMRKNWGPEKGGNPIAMGPSLIWLPDIVEIACVSVLHLKVDYNLDYQKWINLLKGTVLLKNYSYSVCCS